MCGCESVGGKGPGVGGGAGGEGERQAEREGGEEEKNKFSIDCDSRECGSRSYTRRHSEGSAPAH